MDLQATIDALTAGFREERRRRHLMLGQLIDVLEKTPPETIVVYDVGGSPAEPDSYRGYYEDLAFEARDKDATAAGLLAECRSVMGRTLQGYKGGDYLMHENTVLWLGSYGRSDGRAIVGSEMRDGRLVLLTR